MGSHSPVLGVEAEVCARQLLLPIIYVHAGWEMNHFVPAVESQGE